MSIPGSINPLLLTSAAAAGGFQVSRSLRFNASDSAYLSRTPAVAGDRKTWTWAGWVKRSKVDSQQMLFRGGTTLSDTGIFNFQFLPNGEIRCDSETTEYLRTTQVFRDPSAWYHIVIAFDVTQGTNANKLKLYVNGSEITAYSIDARNSLSNQNYGVNQAQGHVIGAEPITSSRYLDGYLADIHFIDGQALTPSSFTEVSATTGQLIPKAYTGTYGTNGFYLKFNDNSTTAALGTDSSGNGNTWTTNNFSVTAGAGNDSLVDTPTSYGTDTGVGGEVRGNYATLNPLSGLPASRTLSDGNLQLTTTTGGGTFGTSLSTIAVSSGKWYFELTCGNYVTYSDWAFGIAVPSFNNSGGAAGSYIYSGYDGTKQSNGSASAYGQAYTTNDVIGCAFDADNGTLTFFKNGASQGQAFSGITGTYAPVIGDTGSGSMVAYLNFGQRPFAYTAPSGFKALCDTNLPAPVVTKPNTLMDVVLWTGNNSSPRAITGLGFNPDFVWIKERSASTYYHRLFDSVRGTSNSLYLPGTEAENTYSSGYANVSSFDSSGFTLTDTNGGNNSAVTYVGWAWDGGTTTVSNTQGSITSQVRANVSAGFSVVTYTGTGSTASVGHGLGVAPQLLIVKRRSSAGATANWAVWHGSLTAGQNLFLNTTDSASAYSPSRFTSTLPTSTVFSLGGGDETNYSGGTFVAYAFTPVVGYTSMGSYVGDGSTSGFGPFVYCGFKPKFVLIKGSSVAYSWLMFDSVRNPYNLTTQVLYADSSTSEMTNNGTGSGGYESIDILSNGFQIKSNSSRYNQSGATYIYYAVAESPFQYARAR